MNKVEKQLEGALETIEHMASALFVYIKKGKVIEHL